LGVPLIRAFAFGTIGHIVTRLIDTQQKQQKKLLEANLRLSEHADTLEQLATSRERNRLARELHDTLAHTLSGLAVNLESIKILLGDEHPEINNRIDHALENTRTGLTDTRRALRDLRAKQVEDLGLELALESLAENASIKGNFHIQVLLPDNMPEISIETEQSFYRIAQESLENIVKHSQADKVLLTLQNQGETLSLSIEDNGVGFDTDGEISAETLGIQGMYERAAECNGVLSITSKPSHGTLVNLTLDLSHV
jgi:signal transduction histidine kinase